MLATTEGPLLWSVFPLTDDGGRRFKELRLSLAAESARRGAAFQELRHLGTERTNGLRKLSYPDLRYPPSNESELRRVVPVAIRAALMATGAMLLWRRRRTP